MSFYNPFVQDEDELIAQDPATAANMGPPVPTPPQDNTQAVPPQMLPPDLLKQESIFDNPDFQALQQLVNRRPSPEEQARRSAEDNDMRTRSMFSNLAAIASGGRPTPAAELDKLIYDKRRQQDDDKINKYKTLLDMYGNVQTSQNNAAQKRLTTLNTYMDSVPGSPKAKQNAANFLSHLEHYKMLAKQNAKQMNQDPEELMKIISNIDSYAANADKMSFSQQEKLKADLDKNIGQDLSAGRNVAMAQQSQSGSEFNKSKEEWDRKMDLARNQNERDRIENERARQELAREQHAEGKSEKQSADEEKEWERYNKSINPDSARGIIGNAKNTIGRYKRLEKIMNNPKGMTPQDYNIAAADLAAMVTGGNPTVSATEESKYSTLKSNIADIWQKVKSDPAYINTPGIKEHILENGKEMAKVAREYIKSNIKQATLTHSKLLNKNPENKIRAAKMNAEMMEEKDKVDLAEKALSDPSASEQDKAAAKKIIEHYAGD